MKYLQYFLMVLIASCSVDELTNNPVQDPYLLRQDGLVAKVKNLTQVYADTIIYYDTVRLSESSKVRIKMTLTGHDSYFYFPVEIQTYNQVLYRLNDPLDGVLYIDTLVDSHGEDSPLRLRVYANYYNDSIEVHDLQILRQ